MKMPQPSFHPRDCEYIGLAKKFVRVFSGKISTNFLVNPVLHGRGNFADVIKLLIQFRKETVLDFLDELSATTQALC